MKKSKLLVSIFVLIFLVLNYISTSIATTSIPDITAGAAILMDSSSRKGVI